MEPTNKKNDERKAEESDQTPHVKEVVVEEEK